MSGGEHREVRDLSTRALIAAVHPDPAGFAGLAAARADRIDWSWLLGCAQAHKVPALVAARMEQSGVQPYLPEAIRARAARLRQEAREQAQRAQQALRELAEGFARAGVPFFVIKGSVLAEHIYRDPTLRRFFDIDVVVPPAELRRAEQQLRSWGYHIGQAEKLLARALGSDAEVRAAEELTQRFYQRFEYELPLVPAKGDGRMAVDVHWHVAPPHRLRATAAQLWAQTVPVCVAGTEVRTFNPEATLIHLAVHATSCTFAGFRLLHLCDVAWAVARRRAPHEPLWALADAWNARAQLDAALEMVERVLQVAVPPGMRTRPRRSGAWLRAAAGPTFLLDGWRGTGVSAPKRLGAELLWGLGMGCLMHNLRRSMRVRRARLEWMMQRRVLRRARSAAAAP